MVLPKLKGHNILKAYKCQVNWTNLLEILLELLIKKVTGNIYIPKNHQANFINTENGLAIFF